MSSLFNNATLTPYGDLLALTERYKDDHAFKVWIERAPADVMGFARILVQCRIARSLEEAVGKLYEIHKAHPPAEKQRITSVDMKDGRYTRSLASLRRQFEEESGNNEEYIRGFGVFLHAAAQRILTGQVGDKQKTCEELSLFPAPQPLFESGFVSIPRITRDFARQVKKKWKFLARQLGRKNWERNYLKLDRNKFRALFKLLMPLIGESGRALLERKQHHSDFQYYLTLTVMTLATIISYVQKIGLHGGLREIPILSYHYGLGGWRMDLILVTAIGGKTPTEKQRLQVNSLQKMTFHSLNQVLSELERIFHGARVDVEFYEFKFATGDGLHARHVILPTEINGEPIAEHKVQLKKYIALANLDYALMHKQKDIWNGNVKFTDAKLVYFFPSIAPVEYRIHVDGPEQHEVFMETIGSRYGYSQTKALIRDRGNAISNAIQELIHLKKGKNGKNGKQNGQNGSLCVNETLIDVQSTSLHPHDEIAEVIKSQRIFLDEAKIVEKVRVETASGRHSPYRFHLDAFFHALEEGDIRTRHFSMERGGFIQCVLPWHEDKNPSMMLFMRRGYARCYVCDTWMPFAYESMPPEVRIDVLRRQRINSLESLEKIPAFHVKAMTLMQQVFQVFFKDSPGKEYLENERRLDPELARAYGAGFCSNDAIETLLDLFEFDELVHYGLVNFNGSLRETQGLFPLLKRRGKSLSDVATKDGLPYLVLRNKLVFPLGFSGGRITSFYGRDVRKNCPKEMRHRKTLVHLSGVPQGMWNADALATGPRYKDFNLMEAVIDALTMIQLEHTDTGAFGGTFNYLALQHALSVRENVCIGFDVDAGGKFAKQKTLKWLDEMQFTERVRFKMPPDFVEEYPRLIAYKDINEWWINEGIYEKQ